MVVGRRAARAWFSARQPRVRAAGPHLLIGGNDIVEGWRPPLRWSSAGGSDERTSLVDIVVLS